MNELDEVWEPIPGYEEFYEVSNKGRIKSKTRYVNKDHGQRCVNQKILKTNTHPSTGHIRVQLSKNHTIKTVVVYKLVLECVGKLARPDGYDVRHIDGNRQNNCLSNLEWVPAQPANRGIRNKNATISDADVIEMRRLAEAGLTVHQIATKMQVSKAQTSKIIAHRTRRDI